MNSEQLELKVLILYQGDEGTKFREHLNEYILQISQKKALGQWIITPTTFKGGGPSLENETYKDFRRCLSKCDVAIAIVSEDLRPASSCGNLWFELGLCCGMKSDKDILVLVQLPPDTYDEKVKGPFSVNPPSDILGRSAPRFRTAKEMDAHVIEFIAERVREKSSIIENIDTRYSCIEKIGDTITCKCTAADMESLFACSSKDRLCIDSKRELYCLSSELIRMFECNGEHTLIEAALFKISNTLNQIFELIPENSKLSWTYRRKFIIDNGINLKSQINELADLLNNVFVRESYSDDLGVWGRLQNFFQYRIQVLAKLSEYGFGFERDFDFNGIHNKTELFTQWVRDFLRSSDIYIKPILDNKVEEINKNVEIMFESASFARDMALVLDCLSSTSFRNYLSLLRQSRMEVCQFDFASLSLKDFRKKLPHNVSNGAAPRIWPRSEEEKKKDNKEGVEVI